MGGIVGKVTDFVGLTDNKGNKRAAEAAAQAQTQAASEARDVAEKIADKQIDFQKWLYNEQKDLNHPWQVAGEAALHQMEQAPDFTFTPESIDKFYDPSYNWRVDQGVKALDRSAASRGRLRSGAQDQAITQFGQDMATQEYQNAFNRQQAQNLNDYNIQRGTYDTNQNKLRSLMGVGTAATGNIQNAGANMGNAINSAYGTSGQAQQGAIMDRGNAIAQSVVGAQNANNQSRNSLLGSLAGLGGAFLGA